MTKATIHTLLILLILLTGSGCSRIQHTPAAPVDACPVEPAPDTRLSINSCPDDMFAPGTPGRDPEMSARYHYLTFLMLHRQNRIDDAMAALKKAIDLDPDASFLKRDLIRIYLSMDQEETALALAESLVAENPDNVENLLLLARLKKDDTREKNMPSLLQRILELAPDNRETYLRLGKIYMENQQIPDALALFSQMADRLPDYYVAHFYLGEAHFLSGNYTEAAQAFQATIDLEPDLIEPRLRLVDILQDPDNPAGKPDPDKLLAMYEQILDIEPENDRALLETARLLHQTGQTTLAAQQFMDLGDQARHDNRLLMTAVDLYLSQNRYADAVLVFSGMLAADPDNDNFNFFLGLAHESNGQPEQAIDHYLKVSPAHPQYKKTQLTLAFLYREIGQTEKAVAFLEQHHRQAPDDIDFITYLAAFYENENQLEKAMALLSKGLENARENTALLFRLGAVQDKAGLKDESIATMKEIIRLDPEDASALNYLGYTYADLGIHLDDAEVLIRKALEIKPNDGYILDSMGWVYFQQGKFDKAVGYLERAAELTDYEAIIAAHLADAYLKTGQKIKALKTFHKALAQAEESDTDLISRVTEKIMTLEQQIQNSDALDSNTVTP
ncbi:MAG: tetratricopeptide repeat protein [Desulfotignum sp.]|nr:tetratricopeptide repeat protein [Desulfotignum sp.]MCF8138049.1 tetratricopeptide repeat protein [Desulfotignum sp.]